MKNWNLPIELEGDHIKLIPLSVSHEEGLAEAAEDGKLWELWYTSVPKREKTGGYIRHALDQNTQGKELPFTVVNKKDGTIIGSTRYYNLEPAHRRLEIGYTWYAKSHQRTAVNSESKLLLLQYAFESLNCTAVQFMTNWHNFRSRNAIARLGAKQDGVLRNHRLNADGTYRDTVVFSITEQEWPGVKKNLKLGLNRFG